MTLRIEPARRAPRLPVDWYATQRRRIDVGPPRMGAYAQAALFVFAALACTYLVAWWFA